VLLATLVILGSVDGAWVILGERFRALLAEVAEQMPAEDREQATHYWAYGEWERVTLLANLSAGDPAR
jgi:hypothetical protein